VRIISFSLYGTSPMYLVGAVENAKLMPIIYPGWTMFVYHGAEVDQITLQALRLLGCETILMPHLYGTEPTPLVGTESVFGKFWRFQAMADPRAEYVLFRDCDSRLNCREVVAVQHWLASGTLIHTMKDHRNHDRFHILAGMWGIKAGVVDIMSLLRDWPYSGDWFDDQVFLQHAIWPLVNHSSLRHGGGAWHKDRVPFPPHPPYVGFVGQRVTHDGKLLYE